MNIWKISIRNLNSKPLYTFLSAIILSLSIALLLGVQQLKSSFQYQMENNLGKIDLVIGAKGSPLQLVLASVLHLDNPTGNISYEDAERISKNPMVKSAVPISYGDNYKGFRIVGTTPTFLTLYDAKLQHGRIVEESMEVILGASVAATQNLQIGDTFLSSHGLVENDMHVHNEKLKVVGILKPTKKIIDRLIITNLESIWDVHHHEEHHEADGEHHEEEEHYEASEEHHSHQHKEKEITSLLLSFRNPTALLTFPRKINKETNMQAAIPKYELKRLYEYTSIGFTTISWIAYLILLISGIVIFISLYKMIKERAFDLALLRTYGASNFQLIRMMLYESFLIVGISFASALLLVKAGLFFIFKVSAISYSQNMLQELALNDILPIALLVFITMALSVALAVLPIMKMNISTTLSHEK